MEQTDTDWGDWPMADQGDIDAMIDEYKHTELGESLKQELNLGGDDNVSNDYSLYDDENMSVSGESEDSEDGQSVGDLYSGIRNGHDAGSFTTQREGMATCEFCGRLGVKHAFYSKSKRFCSLACSRSYSASQKDKKQTIVPNKSISDGKKMKQNNAPASRLQTTPGHTKQQGGGSFDWAEFFSENPVCAAPVSSFRHCPMSDCWDNITVGMKVEVVNKDCDLPSQVFWIATVVKIAGYKALMRYEGFGTDPAKDFWVNLCTQDVHPVGWCATHGKPLVPPQTIQNKYSDWKDTLVKRLTGARTLPNNFYNKVIESMTCHPIKKPMRVEVVDKMCVSAMRVATVDEIIGGRLRLQYDDARGPGDDFWCHRESSLVHPVGWSQLVGHKLTATPEYKTESFNKITLRKYSETDTSPDMFVPTREPPCANVLKFRVGMKLEAIDPLNLSTICVATVMKVLRNNYLMIGIDGSIAENGSDWFCYHATSPSIFPVGFCEINGLALTPPRNYKGEFKWMDYLAQTKSATAPVKLFDKDIPKHGFRIGQKVEAVDLMEPRWVQRKLPSVPGKLICVGTITRVVGRLLSLHFDGWESTYDQWLDCDSPDFYPVGWCEMVGYNLEGPKPREPPPAPQVVPRKRKTKNQMYRGPRKKRKPKLPVLTTNNGGRPRLCTPQSSLDFEDWSQSSTSTTDSLAPLSAATPTSTTTEPSQQHTALKPKMSEPSHNTLPEKSSLQLALTSIKPEPVETKPEIKTSPSLTAFTPAPSPVVMNTKVVDMSPVSDVNPRHAATHRSLAMTRGSPVRVSGMSALALSLQQQPPPNVTLTTSSVRSFTSPPLSTIAAVLHTSSPPRPLMTTRTTPTSPAAGVLAASPQKLTLPLQTTTGAATYTNQPLPLQTTTGTATYTNQPLQTFSPGQATKPESPGAAFPSQTATMSYHIPRVIPGEPEKDIGYSSAGKDLPITPELWSVYDVCQFLRINDCGAYCDSFSKKNISGKKFMTLTKEQIVNLTGMKVGPSLKIYDLIQQLKITVASQQPKAVLVSACQAAVATTSSKVVMSSQQVSPAQSPQHHRVVTQSPALQQLMASPPQPAQSMTLKSQLSQSSSISLSPSLS